MPNNKQNDKKLKHAPQAELNVPVFASATALILALVAYAASDGADTQIVLLCADGRLSTGAAAVLEAASFTNVCTLGGGLNAWALEAAEALCGLGA